MEVTIMIDRKLTFNFNNYAKPIGTRAFEDGETLQFFKWKVFMDEPDDVLDQVRLIEYKLHPTFPKPIRKSTDRGSKFALETEGWGNFWLGIAVHLKSGEVVHQRYLLNLGQAWPEKGG
jgi:transcription initiation factor IIF auxiliary subunit